MLGEENSLRIASSAVSSFRALPLKAFKQVMDKILSLQDHPRPQDCKAVTGFSGGYRVDQGEYRILYKIEGAEVFIFRLGKRSPRNG